MPRHERDDHLSFLFCLKRILSIKKKIEKRKFACFNKKTKTNNKSKINKVYYRYG